ncbi:MAG: hypothetical protein JXD23_10090 [Spirochaetales bacterium]|nr:hypothetical protein [Spirochaetales bacterium]
MKRLRMSMAMPLLVFGFLAGSAAFGEAKWKLAIKSEYTQKVTIAGFLNIQDGITAGYGGATYYSSDGGKTWERGRNSSWCRFGLEILDDKNAWTCGNQGHVRASHDNGATWGAMANFGPMEPRQCRFLSFPDASTGWIASPQRLAATTDGAHTWREIELPQSMQCICAIDFLSRDKGYLLMSSGVLYFTKDGAKTWSALQPDFNGKKFLKQERPAATAALRFADEKRGTLVALTEGENLQWAIFKTVDGGKTWQEESPPDELKALGEGVVFMNHEASVITVTDTRGKAIYVFDRT